MTSSSSGPEQEGREADVPPYADRFVLPLPKLLEQQLIEPLSPHVAVAVRQALSYVAQIQVDTAPSEALHLLENALVILRNVEGFDEVRQPIGRSKEDGYDLFFECVRVSNAPLLHVAWSLTVAYAEFFHELQHGSSLSPTEIAHVKIAMAAYAVRIAEEMKS